MRLTPAPLYSLRNEILPKYRTAFEFERNGEGSDIEISKLATEAVMNLLYKRCFAGQELPSEVAEVMNAHPNSR